jgi:AGCS family alanine or glycine:cation symporter
MAWFNIIAILLLKTALLALKDYEKQRKAGKDPVLIQKILGCQMPIFGIR